MIVCNYCNCEKDKSLFRIKFKDPLCYECYNTQKREKYRLENPKNDNICNTCGIEKDKSDFIKNTKCCKDCKKDYRKEYYLKNKEYYIKYSKEKSKTKERKAKQKEYQLKNSERIKEYQSMYREENKVYLKMKYKERWKFLRDNEPHVIAWRSILKSAIKRIGGVKSKNTIEHLGYSPDDLKNHIESLFLEGMTWENWGEWHIDHIFPVSKFNKDTPLHIVNSLNNLQPLWAIDNIKKGNKYDL